MQAGAPQYAIDMFAMCVAGDPGNVVFLQAFLGALRQKFGAKKSSAFASFMNVSGRSSMRKAATNANWRDVVKLGVATLKSNPADHTCLLSMAEACENLMMAECQAVYLRAALDAAPADIEVNRQCSRFAASQGNFDQAIECWRRIARVKSMTEESEREIARLSVEKTIAAGHGLTGRPGAKQSPGGDAAGPAASRRAKLEQAIRDNPTEIDTYLELADVLEQEATIEEAEKVLTTALAASGNALKVQEHIEDRHLRWGRAKLMLAEKRLEAQDSPDNRMAVEKLKNASLRQEIHIYEARCRRYPDNVTWKYELALRLKAAGKMPEAIRSFQDSLKDVRRKGVISLELGECFQTIKQYQLALQNYEAAIEVLTDRELELRKRALYRAGVLAAALKDVDTAQKHLSAVATLDFSYRDVAQRLDKLRSARDKDVSDD
jgi:tetratricopeptide (TPR) repeat protein